MAGEFNLYSQYAQTQAPISQFVPEKLPWELIYQVGANKQANQDNNVANFKKAAADFDPYAYHANDAKYNQEIKKKIDAIVEESYNKDYGSSSHAADDVVNKITALKEDEGVKAAAAHTEWRKNLDKLATEYAKDAELAPENFYKDIEASKIYGQREDISLDRNYFGNIDNAKGLDINKEAKDHMGTIAASDKAYATNFQGIGYAMKTKAVTADDISRVAGAGFDTWVNSSAGKQLSNRFDMYKDSGNPMMTTKYKEVKGKDGVKKLVADGQRELTKGEYLFNTLTGAVENQKFKSSDSSDFVRAAEKETDYQRAQYEKQKESLNSEALKVFRPGNTTIPMDWLEGVYTQNTDGSFNVDAGNMLVGIGDASNYSEKELLQSFAAKAYKDVDTRTAADRTQLAAIKEARDNSNRVVAQYGWSKDDFKDRATFNKKHPGVSDNVFTTYWTERGAWDRQEKELNAKIANAENTTYAKYGLSRAQALTSDGYKKSQKAGDNAIMLPKDFANVASKFTPTTDKTITVDGTKYLKGTFTLTEEEYGKIANTDQFDAKNLIQKHIDGKNTYYTVSGHLPIKNDAVTLAKMDQNALGKEGYNKNQPKLNAEYAIDAKDRYNKAQYNSVTFNRNFNYLQNERDVLGQVQTFFNSSSTLTDPEEKTLIALLKDPNSSLEDKSLIWDLTHGGGEQSWDANGNKVDLKTLAASLTKNNK